MPSPPSRVLPLVSLALSIALPSGCAVMKDGYRVDPLIADSPPSCGDRMTQFIGWLFFGASRNDPVTERQLLLLGSANFSKTGEHVCWMDASLPELAHERENEIAKLADAQSQLATLDAIPSYYQVWRTSEDVADRVEARNEIVEFLIERSDQMCYDHVARFIGQEAANKLFFGAASLAATGGTAVAGQAAANIWGAIASGFVGANTLVSDTVYYKQLTPVIAAAIRLDQNRKLEQIRLLERSSPDEYGLDRGRADVLQYHASCSFSNGLTVLQQQLAQNAPDVAKTVERSKQATLISMVLAKGVNAKILPKAIALELVPKDTTEKDLPAKLKDSANGEAARTAKLEELLAAAEASAKS